jgi:hypothetical protein
VGPPLNEVIKPYRGDPEGIVNWALVPGRKRQDYPAMPAQEIPKTDLLQIAAYILETTGNR